MYPRSLQKPFYFCSKGYCLIDIINICFPFLCSQTEVTRSGHWQCGLLHLLLPHSPGAFSELTPAPVAFSYHFLPWVSTWLYWPQLLPFPPSLIIHSPLIFQGWPLTVLWMLLQFKRLWAFKLSRDNIIPRRWGWSRRENVIGKIS